MRYGFSQSSKLPLTLLDALPRLYHVGHIDEMREDAIDLTIQIPGGSIEEVQIQIPGTVATLQMQRYLMPYERFSSAVDAVEQIDIDLPFHLREGSLHRSPEGGRCRAADQAFIFGIDLLKSMLGPTKHGD